MSHEMLIRCCAPTMASLKTGNMFNCPFDSKKEMTAELRRLNQILGPKGLRAIPLRWNDGRALVYLYRPKMLEKDLQNDLAADSVKANNAPDDAALAACKALGAAIA